MFKDILDAMWANPLETVLIIVGGFILLKLLIKGFRFHHRIIRVSPKLVHMKVTIPREESQKDKEKSEVKDFKEKIAVMEQFFRNIHEIGELNLQNIIRTRIFHDDFISFELVAKNKVVDFYVVVPKRYQEMIDKQITSYYPNADIRIEEPFDIQPKGNKLKSYYAYQKKPFFYPIKTYKNLDNDPLNSLTNIFSKFDESDVAVMQVIVKPETNRKWQKKTEKAGSTMFSGKKPGGFKIPGLSFIGSILRALIFGADKMEKTKEGGSGPYGGGGYVRMLQSREEIAKKNW